MAYSVRVSLSLLRRAWDDTSRTAPEVARDFGMSTRTLNTICKAQGWPSRSSRQRGAVLTPDAVKPLWDAGLRASDIAILLKSSTSAVQAVAWRQGWRRFKGWRAKVTLAEWHEDQLAAKMARHAQGRRAA